MMSYLAVYWLILLAQNTGDAFNQAMGPAPMSPWMMILVTIILQVFQLLGQWMHRHLDKKDRASIKLKTEESAVRVARVVESHHRELKDRLEVNTKLTEEAKDVAAKAYKEANNFNEKLREVQKITQRVQLPPKQQE